MAERKTIYIPDEAQKIIDAAPGNSLSAKITGIVIRYGEIIEIKPELAISDHQAVKDRLKKELLS